jgi:hypothetical protein
MPTGTLTREPTTFTPLFAGTEPTAPPLGWYSVEPIASTEYAAVENPPLKAQRAPSADEVEFDAILKMKTDPLELTTAEALHFRAQRHRRARRVGKPLPLE